MRWGVRAFNLREMKFDLKELIEEKEHRAVSLMHSQTKRLFIPPYAANRGIV